MPRIHVVLPSDRDDDSASPAAAAIAVEAGQLPALASRGEAAIIAARRPVFQRDRKIVRPVIAPAKLVCADGSTRIVHTPAILQLDIAAIVDELGQSATWTKYNERKRQQVPCDPSERIARAIASRAGLWHLSPLRGVITAPTLRPDGSLLDSDGYDAATGLFMLSSLAMPGVPDRPTMDQARNALAVIDALLAEFPFVAPVDKSVARALLMTVALRAAMDIAPLFIVTAPTAGTGKSYLVDIAAYIATGAPCAVTAVGPDPAETEKRLVGLLIGGRPFIGLDNCNGTIGGDVLSQATSQPKLSLRGLGKSEMHDIDNWTVIVANGNNVRVTDDLPRRTMRSRMDAKLERPETRTFNHNPVKQVQERRGQYVAAILTIARAYLASGVIIECEPLVGFAAWTRFVRQPLLWLDCADPADSVAAVRAENPQLGELRRMFTVILGAIGTDNFTAGTLAALADVILYDQNGNPEHADLRDTLAELFGDRGKINVRRLGNWLAKHNGSMAANLTVNGATYPNVTLKALPTVHATGAVQYQVSTATE